MFIGETHSVIMFLNLYLILLRLFIILEKMPRPILNNNSEKEILKKIRFAEAAYSITPYGSVKEAAAKELQKLYKELEEIRNPK